MTQYGFCLCANLSLQSSYWTPLGLRKLRFMTYYWRTLFECMLGKVLTDMTEYSKRCCSRLQKTHWSIALWGVTIDCKRNWNIHNYEDGSTNIWTNQTKRSRKWSQGKGQRLVPTGVIQQWERYSVIVRHVSQELPFLWEWILMEKRCNHQMRKNKLNLWMWCAAET